MRYTFSTEVQRQLKEINKKDRKLSKKIYKLSGKMKNQYSISVTQGFRMTYTLLGDGAHFTKIGTHDEVYKNN